MKTRLLLSLFIAISTIATAKPKLVVNIVVGQMRYDYLLRYGDNFSDKGFKRLFEQGVSCERATYNYLSTNTASGLATIATGSNPATHGIIGASWYNYSAARQVEVIQDPAYRSVGTDELDTRVSPRATVVSTLSDALKALSPQSKVINIAFEPGSSVIIGGYSADAAYWVSPREGNIVTSSYYQPSLPSWVSKFNDTAVAESYSSAKWIAYLASSQYKSIFRKDILMEDTGMSFEFMTRKKYDYQRLSTTPMANTMLKDLAVQAVIYESLGSDQNTDILNIVFDPMRLIGEKYGTQSIEIEDAYYRLDAEIGALVDFLEIQVGRENLLVVLTSDHEAADPMIESSKIPTGRFNTQQFSMLVNGFVGGLLGPGERWILDYSNNQIYFNRRLMLDKGVDMIDLQNKIASFAIQFTGVSRAITSNALQSSYFTQGLMNKAQNSYSQLHSGDLLIVLLPGWANDNGTLSDGGSPYNYDTHVPLLWYGGGIGNQNLARDVDMTDITPTIAHLLQIAPPNASTGKPIIEIYSK